MRRSFAPNRPAIAAIAAVLAISTAPAGAQLPPDAPADPVIVPPEAAVPAPAPAPDPVILVPTVPVQSAPPPVQPGPATEVVQPVPITPEVAEETPPQRQATPVARAPRAAPEPAAPEPAAIDAVRPDALPLPSPTRAPETTEAVAPAIAQPDPVAAPEPASVAANRELAWWALGVGGLLFAGGLGALAMSQRRRPVSVRPVQARDSAPTSPPVREPRPFAPAPVAAAAAAPMPFVTAAPPRAAMAYASRWPELEEMVAARPDAANPFLTRKKRLRRAKFLMEHGEVQPLHMPQEIRREVAPAREPEKRPQPVYAFSRPSAPARPSWKPIAT